MCSERGRVRGRADGHNDRVPCTWGPPTGTRIGCSHIVGLHEGHAVSAHLDFCPRNGSTDVFETKKGACTREASANQTGWLVLEARAEAPTLSMPPHGSLASRRAVLRLLFVRLTTK